jgi:tRNA(fMet)-specific endonuclease VapC
VKFLLDANIIIMVILAENEALRERMAAWDEGDFVTSAIAYGEVAHGSVHGKPPPFDVLQRFIAKIPPLPFDHNAARVYATLSFKRASYDRLIAAHALALGLTVITENDKHFTDVPGLKVENWTV